MHKCRQPSIGSPWLRKHEHNTDQFLTHASQLQRGASANPPGIVV